MVSSGKEPYRVGPFGQHNRLLRRRDDGLVAAQTSALQCLGTEQGRQGQIGRGCFIGVPVCQGIRSEEHTSELQSLAYLVCRLLLEKKKKRVEAQYTSAADER